MVVEYNVIDNGVLCAVCVVVCAVRCAVRGARCV